MQEFLFAAIIKMNYLFLDVVFANLCCSKFFLVNVVSLATAPHRHFHRARQTAVRTGKAAAELLVLYSGAAGIRPALILVQVQLTPSAGEVWRGSLTPVCVQLGISSLTSALSDGEFLLPVKSGEKCKCSVRTLMRPTSSSFKV